MGVWGQPPPNPPALYPLSPFKFPRTRRKGSTRCEILRKAPLPVRILLVSEGHRSKARIPGMLALCSPYVRESPKLMPQVAKHSQNGIRKLHVGISQSFSIQALTTCEATCRYLLSSSGFTSSSGTVLPLWKKQAQTSAFPGARHILGPSKIFG